MTGAIRSEILKIFTTRLWWGMLIGVVIAALGLSAAFAALVGFDGGQNGQGNGQGQGAVLSSGSPGAAQFVYSSGFIVASIAALFPLALGVLLITQEFRHKTFTATVLATPKRSEVVVSKIISLVVVGALYAVVYDIAAVIGGASVLRAKGYDTYLGSWEIQKTLLVMLLAFVVWTLLGFGFGMLIRNQIAAVLVAVGAAFLLQIVLNIAFGILGWDTAAQYVPGNLTAGMLVTDDTGGAAGGGSTTTFSWWVCALILTGYAIVMAGVGSVLTARRDIT